MKADDIIGGFELLLDSFLHWVGCLTRPSSVAQEIIDVSASTNDAIKRVAIFWLTPFALSLLLQSWVYQLYGLGLANIAFHATFTIFSFLTVMSVAVSIYFSLRLFKFKIGFKETFVTYAIYASMYSPFLSLLASPLLAQEMEILKKMKAISPEIENAPQIFYADLIGSQNTPLGAISIYCMAVLGFAGIILLSAALESLASRYQLRREKVLSAGSFSMVLATPLMAVLSLISNLVLYAHL